jgi:hypothetical protein
MTATSSDLETTSSMAAKLLGEPTLAEIDPNPQLNPAEWAPDFAALSPGAPPPAFGAAPDLAGLPDIPGDVDFGGLGGFLPGAVGVASYRPWIMVAVIAIAVAVGSFGYTYTMDPSDEDWQEKSITVAKGMVHEIWDSKPIKAIRPYLATLTASIVLVFSLGFTPQSIAIWLATADFHIASTKNAGLIVKNFTAYTGWIDKDVPSMWDTPVALTPAVMNKIITFWSFPFMQPHDQAIRDRFEMAFQLMQRHAKYSGAMLSEFSDELASYFISSLTYMSMESPAFSISDSLPTMQQVFKRFVNPMAGVRGVATDFVNYVTDSLINYAIERARPQLEAAGGSTMMIVAAVGVGAGLYLYYNK